jgi:hypothetical protein
MGAFLRLKRARSAYTFLRMPATLSELLFWGAVAVCGVAQLLVLRSTFAGRAHAPDPALPTARVRRRSAVELLWAIIPPIALAVVLWATWGAVRPQPSPSQRSAAASAAAAGE